jgi:hypothetical protein
MPQLTGVRRLLRGPAGAGQRVGRPGTQQAQPWIAADLRGALAELLAQQRGDLRRAGQRDGVPGAQPGVEEGQRHGQQLGVGAEDRGGVS